jgi:hypothetical protein
MAKAKKKYTKKDLAPVTRAFNAAVKHAAKKHPEVAQTKLVAHPEVHDSPRHYAEATIDGGGPIVRVAPELATQPVSVIRGIVYHELGHIIILLGAYPARAGYDAAERQADRVAEEVFDTKIYYNKARVQCAGPGARGKRPRPRGLR